jgi:hypothetical protein
MVCDYLVQLFKLPPILRFLPEMMSTVVIVYALFAGTLDRFRLVSPKYWIVFGALAVVILCGIINNNPGAGPLISGMRFCFRSAPLFFLAAVLPINEVQLARQFKVLLALAFIQLPLTAYQRWVIVYEERFSGDDVRGTLMDSGILSMFLICAVLVLTGLLLKRRIGKLAYAVLFLVLLLPTTINETKATVIFLPLGLLVTTTLGAERGKRLRNAGVALAALVVFGSLFVPIYDYFERGNPYKIEIVDFFTNEQALSKYVVASSKGEGAGIGGTGHAHRGEAIRVAFRYLSKDPALLAFGLGLGNVSPSNTGKNFEGTYFNLFQNILVISFNYFLLEFGILGVALICVLSWMIFSDSLAVARRDDSLTGALAAGWAGVCAVVALAMLYNQFHFYTSVTFLYWYFSGVVCARRMALRYQEALVPRPAVHPPLTIPGSSAV